MGLFDSFKKSKVKDESKPDMPEYLYTEEEIEELDSFISERIGEYQYVFHEMASPDIHLDVCIVEPGADEPYYKLVTMGAGAYRMRIPDAYEEYRLEHAEYIINLPKDWNINSGEEEHYWPIRLLKDTARLPIWNDTWLFYGHTMQHDADGSPYASNTKFNSAVLNFGENNKGDVRLIMSSGKVINFYEIIPLYPEELQFKRENDADTLFTLFKQKGISCKVLDINRKNAID